MELGDLGRWLFLGCGGFACFNRSAFFGWLLGRRFLSRWFFRCWLFSRRFLGRWLFGRWGLASAATSTQHQSQNDKKGNKPKLFHSYSPPRELNSISI
jgi:hypothetical protein